MHLTSTRRAVPDETLQRVAPLASAPRKIPQTSPQQPPAQQPAQNMQQDAPLTLTPEMSVPAHGRNAHDQDAHGQDAHGQVIPSQSASLFLIMAEVASENRMQFLQTLQKIGTPQRIGEANWLMQSSKDIDDVRNSLAAAMTREDRLFIMDSVNNRTAWFNIGTDMAKRIKELWKRS